MAVWFPQMTSMPSSVPFVNLVSQLRAVEVKDHTLHLCFPKFTLQLEINPLPKTVMFAARPTAPYIGEIPVTLRLACTNTELETVVVVARVADETLCEVETFEVFEALDEKDVRGCVVWDIEVEVELRVVLLLGVVELSTELVSLMVLVDVDITM